MTRRIKVSACLNSTDSQIDVALSLSSSLLSICSTGAMSIMNPAVEWYMLVVAVLAYYATLAVYRLFLSPLARFPGPKLAAISRWYEAYYDVLQNGKYTLKIAQLHKQYGPIIRISPYELHVIDPAFFETLYRMDGRWDKYAWTYDAFGASDSTLFGSGHDAHKLRRRAIAPFFSKPNVLARQDTLQRNLDKLCRRISNLNGTTFNLGAALSAFTRDNANEFIVGKTYNELDLDDFGVGLSNASQGAGVFWRTTKHIRWFGPLLRAIPISLAMKSADDGTKSFLRYLQQSEQDTRDTLAAATSSSPDSTVRNTMIYEIVHSNLPPQEKTLDRILQEVASATGAGFETTAAALRLILFHVYTSTEILQHLRQELAPITSDPSGFLPLKELEQLPYLTAVIMEGMRLSPAIATRAARITDKDLHYQQWLIPAGTPVGMTTYLMHIDETLYPEPMRFVLDRWIGPKRASEATYAPFSRGTRMCLGMHLAWAEMYLILAKLIPQFDFAIVGATASDLEMERDNFGVGSKAGCNLNARVTTLNI
ncbi:hypothetical protein PG997_002604 [Apiospora hydei]|uniref:Trichodiene oxygenase n=1 Tax=Apiospora hydei TaxID=1337664 RepID=A0ABR1WWY8_9PEZI